MFCLLFTTALCIININIRTWVYQQKIKFNFFDDKFVVYFKL